MFRYQSQAGGSFRTIVFLESMIGPVPEFLTRTSLYISWRSSEGRLRKSNILKSDKNGKGGKATWIARSETSVLLLRGTCQVEGSIASLYYADADGTDARRHKFSTVTMRDAWQTQQSLSLDVFQP